MSKKPLFWEMFTTFVVVGVLDWVAHTYNLYWDTAEFDSLVHFFGGMAIAVFFLWLYFYSGFFQPTQRNFSTFLLIAFLAPLSVAVFWEIYELIVGEAFIQQNKYPFDTTLDFIMDSLGILTACLYAYMRETWKILR